MYTSPYDSILPVGQWEDVDSDEDEEVAPRRCTGQRKGIVGLSLILVGIAVLGVATFTAVHFKDTDDSFQETASISDGPLDDALSSLPTSKSSEATFTAPKVLETSDLTRNDEAEDTVDMSEQDENEAFRALPAVASDSKEPACAELVGGTSKPIKYGGRSKMWRGRGTRKPAVWLQYGRWILSGKKARAMAFLSGFDIGTGPNTRIQISARAVGMRKARVTVATWANSRVWASKYGYLATSLPPTKFAMTTVNTFSSPRVIQFSSKNPQTRSRILSLPCRGQPRIFAGLNHLDVTHTTKINTRLKATAWIKKLKKKNKIEAFVKFQTWSNSKIYAAGAAIAAWCPADELSRIVQTGSVKFQGGGANRMWTGIGSDEANVYVEFEPKMPCDHPQISMGLTGIDFGRNRNYRLFVSPTDANEYGFNAIFKTWANTKVWWASASWVAICPE